MIELLKVLDESVFTPELTQKIQEMYESKISEATAEAEAKVATITESYEAKILEMAEEAAAKEQAITTELTEKAEAYAQLIEDELTEKAEAYGKLIQEELEADMDRYTQYIKEELSKNLDAYIDTVVEEYVEENKIAMDEAVQTQKVQAILEGFDALLVTSGVTLSQIVEAKTVTSPEAEVEGLKESIDKLVKENAKLKTNMVEMAKSEAMVKYSSGMSIVQRDNFEKLTEMVVYTDKDSYTEKLQTIAETILKQPTVETTLSESKTDTSAPAHKRYF